MEPVAQDPARIPIIHGARCLDCNYLLTNLHEPRCPECGRGFDPRRRETYATRAFPAWARLLCKPPGIVLLLLPLFPLGLTLWELRRPGGDFYAEVNGFALFLLIGIIWAIRLVAFLGLLELYGRPTSERRRGMLR